VQAARIGNDFSERGATLLASVDGQLPDALTHLSPAPTAATVAALAAVHLLAGLLVMKIRPQP
jgi:hypothetical protein